jgi:hypothetical protein
LTCPGSDVWLVGLKRKKKKNLIIWSKNGGEKTWDASDLLDVIHHKDNENNHKINTHKLIDHTCLALSLKLHRNYFIEI